MAFDFGSPQRSRREGSRRQWKGSTSSELPIPNVSGKTYLAAARTNNNPPIPKPKAIGSQADRIGVKTAFTPIELVMKENT